MVQLRELTACGCRCPQNELLAGLKSSNDANLGALLAGLQKQGGLANAPLLLQVISIT
jgi:hypothetical protein